MKLEEKPVLAMLFFLYERNCHNRDIEAHLWKQIIHRLNVAEVCAFIIFAI